MLFKLLGRYGITTHSRDSGRVPPKGENRRNAITAYSELVEEKVVGGTKYELCHPASQTNQWTKWPSKKLTGNELADDTEKREACKRACEARLSSRGYYLSHASHA